MDGFTFERLSTDDPRSEMTRIETLHRQFRSLERHTAPLRLIGPGREEDDGAR